MPLLGEFALVVQVRVVAQSVDLVRKPPPELFVKNQVVGVVPNALVANKINALVDQPPALFRSTGHHREVVSQVVTVERPHFAKARLQFGDQIGQATRVVELREFPHLLQANPQVVDHQSAQRAHCRADGNNRRGALH